MGRTNCFVLSVLPSASSKHRLYFVTSTTVKPSGTSAVEMLMVWKSATYPRGNGAERPCGGEMWGSVCTNWKEKALFLELGHCVLPGVGCTEQLSSA